MLSSPVRSRAVMLLVGLTVSTLGLARVQPVRAATLCVNPSSKSACFHSISAAVAAASNGDTITVSSGNYAERLDLQKSIQLAGAGSATTILDPTSQSQPAITVEPAANVSITGLAVELAPIVVRSGGTLALNTSRVTQVRGTAISSDGTLSLTASTVDHVTFAGIRNTGTLTLSSSIIGENRFGLIMNGGTASLMSSSVVNNLDVGIYDGGGFPVTMDQASFSDGNGIDCIERNGAIHGSC